MHVFKHPKYYTELRKLRNKSDQAISEPSSTEQVERAPGSGLKPEASSDKQQATSRKPQAPSDKHQAPSSKPQA